MRSVIILAGGHSKRFGRDKALLVLHDQTLIEHVYGRMRDISNEVVIAVRSERQLKAYSQLVGNCTFALDESSNSGPLIGLSSALKRTAGEKIAIVGCDMPFISPELFEILYELCQGYDAVIPRWPNGYIEPLHAVYDAKCCRRATDKALRSSRSDMRAMISALVKALYLSTESVRRLDPALEMFTNINTRRDLLRAKKSYGSIITPEACRSSVPCP